MCCLSEPLATQVLEGTVQAKTSATPAVPPVDAGSAETGATHSRMRIC